MTDLEEQQILTPNPKRRRDEAFGVPIPLTEQDPSVVPSSTPARPSRQEAVQEEDEDVDEDDDDDEDEEEKVKE